MEFRLRIGSVIAAVALILTIGACGRSDDAMPEAMTPPEQASVGGAQTLPELVQQLRVGADGRVESVAYSPDGQLIAGGTHLEAWLWQVEGGDLVRTIEHQHSIEDLAFSLDGMLLGSGVSTGGVQLSYVADGTALPRLHTGFNNRVAFSPDGEIVATGNRSGLVWLWQIEDGERVAELEVSDADWLTALAFSSDGEILAAGHYDGTVYLWRAEDGSLVRVLEAATDYCKATRLAFSPDGGMLAVAGAREERERGVAVWSAAEGRWDDSEVERQLLDLSQEGRAVAFSPDGRWLAAGSLDGVTIWSMPEAAVVATLDHIAEIEETDWVTDLSFSPDSRLLAVGRWIGVLELWDVDPG